MSLMPSLCAALERAGGDRLVMRAGERPHVLAGDRRHDVASAILSINAVEALADQVLSSAGRQELTANGTVSETLQSPAFPRPLTARAERTGDDFCIELIVTPSLDDSPAAQVMQVMSVDSPPAEAAEEVPFVASPDPEPEPTAIHVAEPEPPPPPAPEVAAPSAYVRPEPVRQPDVTVVTRLHEYLPQATPAVGRPDLFGWISHAASLGATTLYLRAGSPASARIDDRIQALSQEPVDAAIIEESAGTFTRGGDGLWEPRPDGEWVREDDEIGCVSCRVFADVHGHGLLVHLRPSTSLRLLYKHIPRQVRTACEGNGLVVVAASNEADVESLAAAVADWSGRDRGGYLISLQRRTQSHGDIAGTFVSQRTIAGSDKDLATAIRRAAQESPDILLVTGLQAEHALQAAVLAASGGRLVIVGVVAPTTVDALRMVAGSDAHVRRAMAASFRAAIGYRNLRRIGGGRMLVQDLVLATSAVCGFLETADFDTLSRTIRQGASGVRSVDESLARAVKRRQVSLREAATQAIDRRHLVALVRARTYGRPVDASATGPADSIAGSGLNPYRLRASSALR